MRRALVLGSLVVVAGVCPAHADAIDGQWCLGSSHFEINGPNIRTPGGNQITGNYHRHGFSYLVPASEEGAGMQIVMVLLNEENRAPHARDVPRRNLEAVQTNELIANDDLWCARNSNDQPGTSRIMLASEPLSLIGGGRSCARRVIGLGVPCLSRSSAHRMR